MLKVVVVLLLLLIMFHDFDFYGARIAQFEGLLRLKISMIS